MPVYKPDVLKDIADTQRQQAGAFTSAQTRPPTTSASAGWKLTARDEPDPPPSGAHIWGSPDGELKVTKADGTTFTVEPAPEVPPFPQGVAVTSPPLFTSPSNPGDTVDPAEYQALRDDAQALRGVVINLLNSLRTAGLIAT